MVLNLGYNPSNVPNGMHAPVAFMSPPPNLLNSIQVPNLSDQENNHRFHKKRKSPPLKNHFSTDIDYTNKILIGVGIISLVGFAYIISPFKNSRYSFSRSILYNIL
jgi:hypothetical protein